MHIRRMGSLEMGRPRLPRRSPRTDGDSDLEREASRGVQIHDRKQGLSPTAANQSFRQIGVESMIEQ